MLTNIHLLAFKCFDSLDLPLSPLTVLSGINGGGKSSVIQSLVLLNQTFQEREWSRSLLLNGGSLALGSASDVINQTMGGRELSIGATALGEKLLWTFRAEDRRALSMELQSLSIDGLSTELSDPVRWLMPPELTDHSNVVACLKRVSWLSAERAGPRELLPLLDPHQHRYVGMRGELAAGLLYWREADPVCESIAVKDEPLTLFHQVRAWMRVFFPGCDFQVSPVDGASVISLRLRSDPRTDFQRPQNVGFGLTQLFPVLVQVLSAREGDIIIVENPEVHLHPSAQQEVGALLARTAARGVQVLVETHSDHVLNGIRLAVKNSALLDPASVSIHFFTRSSDGLPIRISPKIDVEGRLDCLPAGFFDQFDHALMELL